MHSEMDLVQSHAYALPYFVCGAAQRCIRYSGSEAKRWINFRAHHPEPGGPKELFGFPDC
jgi:hypothetical protein